MSAKFDSSTYLSLLKVHKSSQPKIEQADPIYHRTTQSVFSLCQRTLRILLHPQITCILYSPVSLIWLNKQSTTKLVNILTATYSFNCPHRLKLRWNSSLKKIDILKQMRKKIILVSDDSSVAKKSIYNY